ncbi:MAG TPA: rhomboid family intramembrane serine protease [Spirochaetia bacterium]|nr:rhomboid family intramembrane serine protease [Spirochaetaceae bacterium]HPE89422.1 rhomboid family intramembrane serine protease [Spirochaetales bacterium]HRW24078.1 rhomboid family intramembrane serine protease [Spirochaetia bacterium]
MTFIQRIRKPFRFTNGNVTLVLIGVNVLVYALTSVAREAYVYLAMIPAAVLQLGWVWQPFTYMFVHANLRHLLFNMLGLFFFGSSVERSLGSREFLFFYLLTGALAGLFSLAAFSLGGAMGVSLVGASGAVYAVLLAFAVINPRARIFIWGVVPVPAPILVAGYTVIELWSQLFGSGGGVAHLTHLAGFAFAALYFPIRHGVNPIKRLVSGR